MYPCAFAELGNNPVKRNVFGLTQFNGTLRFSAMQLLPATISH